MAVSLAHCQVMEAVGAYADREWALHGAYIAGETGFASTHHRSVRMSHPSFPIFLSNLGLVPCMSNGAMVDMWGSVDPVSMCVLNVNHSQARKSRLTFGAEELATVIDRACHESLRKIWGVKRKLLASQLAAKRRRAAVEDSPDSAPAHAAPDAEPSPFPGAFPGAFLGGTIERVRERCAGDFDAVKQLKLLHRLPS